MSVLSNAFFRIYIYMIYSVGRIGVVSNTNVVYSSDNVGEIPLHQTESSTSESVMLNRLKSIAHLRMAETRKPAADSLTREELEALRDLLDKSLQKYQNYDERSVKRRPNDPYIGQILNNLNGEPPHSSNDASHNSNAIAEQQTRQQLPIRRKIIRHTVFATPLGANAVGNQLNSNNRVYGGGDVSRIDWSSPWADYFPILIKDPFQTMMNSFSEIIEYGPAADICRHGNGGIDESADRVDRRNRQRMTGAGRPETLKRSRRNTAGTAAAGAEEEKGVLNHVVRPFRPHHGAAATTTTTDAPKGYHWATERPAGEHNGDTGPQIKRLVVRRGGVAIAGPGGIATAGSGGTAIVGPGGSAYSSKDTASGATADAAAPAMGAGGVSMAGYGPQMVQGPPANFYAAYPHQLPGNHVGYGRSAQDAGGTAVLSTDGVVYTFPVPSRGLTAAGGAKLRRDVGPQQRAAAREIVLPDGAKLIATGPIVYYNPEQPAAAKKKKTRKGRGDKPTARRPHRDRDHDRDHGDGDAGLRSVDWIRRGRDARASRLFLRNQHKTVE